MLLGDTGTMLIRGASTMGSGVTPLYIVDGVAVDNISTINPADIESMEILKDAASAAIYGSRSVAGVMTSVLNVAKKVLLPEFQ